MYKILSQFERGVLLSQHAVEKAGEVRDRIKVVLWYDDNWSLTKIAEALFINQTTVTKHLKEYSEGKLSKSSGGSFSKLNFKQSQKLIIAIKEKLYTNVMEIVLLCKKMFNIEYTRTGMTDWLIRHDFSYVKPTQILPKIDVEKQIEHIKIYDKLKRKSEKNNEILLHVDSCHSSMNLKLSKAWIHKENKVFLIKNNAYTRVNITGALNLQNMSLITDNYKTINSDSFISFLAKLKMNYLNKKINIVLDNGRYHKTKEVEKFCINNNIKLYFLPPYSPNLNPIEKVWRVMNRHVKNNIVYDKPKEFQTKIVDFFGTTWDKIKYNLRKEINDNFHILCPI